MNTVADKPVFEFAGFRLDAGQRRLHGPDGQPVTLAARAYDTLLYLLEHPGELLDKDTLMQAVWPNVIVAENNLNQAITQVRHVLGEGHIVTITGRGYQFVTPVKRLSAHPSAPIPPPDPALEAVLDNYFGTQNAGATPDTVFLAAAGQTTARKLSPWWWAGAVALAILLLAVVGLWDRTAPQRVTEPTTTLVPETATTPQQVAVTAAVASIAVLPFADMSPNQDQGYFADGLSEELINQLVQIPGLLIIGRTSSFSFKGKDADLRTIGQSLGVNHILEGSVRKAGNQLRITAQLTDARSGMHAWSQTYERDLDDIFTIQTDIGLKVADAIAAEFPQAKRVTVKRRPTQSSEAYTLYLEAQGLFGRAGNPISFILEKIDRAVELDPEFVEAWLFKARIHQNIPVFFPEQSAQHAAAQAAAVQRAQALAPNSPDVYAARAWLPGLDFLQAQLEINKAIALGGSNFLFLVADPLYASVGYIEKTLEVSLDSQKLNPLHPVTSRRVMTSYFNLGNIDAAMKEYARGKTFMSGFMMTSSTIDATFGLLGNGAVEQARQLIRDDLLGNGAVEDDAPEDKLFRTVLIDSRIPEQALTELRGFYADEAYQHPYIRMNMAALAAFLGDQQLAMLMIKELDNYGGLSYIWQPVFRDVRQLDELKDLMRTRGLVEYWRQYGWPDLCKPTGADDFECEK